MKAKSIIILCAITANLITSVAIAQETEGTIGIQCPNPGTQPIITINDGISSPATLEFEPVSGSGRLNNPIKSGTYFKLTIKDQRGYDSGPGTCGNGFDIVLQGDSSSPFFESASGKNNEVLSIGSGTDNCLTIRGTSWTATPDKKGLFVISEGSESSGINEENIIGAEATEFDFAGNNLSALIATVNESFEGELDIIFEDEGINIDIPSGIPMDRYFKSMVLSLS